MFILDAGHILGTPGNADCRPVTWSGGISPIGGFRGTLSGGSAIGDHGPDYRFDPPEPASHEAILNCGCNLFFPVPPADGELLFCALHDDWFKSHPATIKKPVEYRMKCNTPGCEWSKELTGGPAYTYAKRHAFGKNGHRRTAPHEVLMGKKTASGITWKKYEEKK